MAIRLSIEGPGAREPTELDFDQERVRIGRGALCDVRLPGPAVSAVHAMVLRDRDRYYVVDLGSTNGTTLGGGPLVSERRKLVRTGDLIGIGGFEIRFQAGVAMLTPHSQERTVAAARTLARQVMTTDGLELREPFFEVLGGPQQGERFDIPAAPALLTLGRSESCDIVLVDGEVSREHVEIEVGAEGVTVRDLGGKNPIRIGEREVSRGRLHDRDELLVGSTVLAFEEPVEAFLRELADRPETETERPPPEPVESATGGEAVDDDAPPSTEPDDEPPTGDRGEAGVETASARPSPRRSASEGTAEPPAAAPTRDDAPDHDPPPAQRRHAEPDARSPRRSPGRWGTPGSEVAVLLVGALALAACVAALVWLFR